MTRYERAAEYHHKGFNCCQAVLASFHDVTGLSEQTSFDMGGGFGAGAQTGELCGAIAGAVMTLGMLTPVDAEDPVGSKRRTGALAATCDVRPCCRARWRPPRPPPPQLTWA